MKRRTKISILGLMIPFFFSGNTFCFAQNTPDPTTPVTSTNNGFLKLETISSTRDLDAENVNAIKARMNQDSSMKTIAKDVVITSRDSVIYVTGKVLSNNERLRVLDHARSISAANRVVDRIEIIEPTTEIQ